MIELINDKNFDFNEKSTVTYDMSSNMMEEYPFSKTIAGNLLIKVLYNVRKCHGMQKIELIDSRI